ncbi:MAG: diguanylate cyclase [Deltaproteobacteria bacterium]|nr:diguanylate cyclase [Deltaproteobacteria bacterium]
MVVSQSIILVVDDELFFRELYCDLLAGEGYRVEVCESGEDAIIRLQQGSVDLVLADMVMPGKSGLDVLRAARLLSNPPEVILVTGHASVESAIQALKNGARDYLVKPFNAVELKHLIRTGLDQRRLLAENDHLKEQIQLFQTGQTLSSLIDLERLIPQALDVLIREIGAVGGCGFTFKAGMHPNVSVLRNLRDDVAGRLLERLLPQLSDAAASFPLKLLSLQSAADFKFDPERLWLLPLSGDDELTGGLLVVDAPDRLDQQITLPDLRYLCDQIRLGFENACRLQSAQELMHTDDLTGLYNHRYLQVAIDQEIRRSQRYGLQFSLLFFDLDRFKDINDRYGHLAGSAALQEVGGLLRQCVRDVDTLFRFGGDEFAAMLVETDGRTARIVAERIRKTIDEHVFLAEQGKPSHVTATAGYATFPTDAVEKDLLLDLADRAMYAGKRVRNIVHGVKSLPEK